MTKLKRFAEFSSSFIILCNFFASLTLLVNFGPKSAAKGSKFMQIERHSDLLYGHSCQKNPNGELAKPLFTHNYRYSGIFRYQLQTPHFFGVERDFFFFCEISFIN